MSTPESTSTHNIVLPRFMQLIGLYSGGNCTCYDSLPLDNLMQVNEESECNMPCSGNSMYSCGGLNAVLIYTAGIAKYFSPEEQFERVQCKD